MHLPNPKIHPAAKKAVAGSWKVAKTTHRYAEIGGCALGRWLVSQNRHRPFLDISLLGFWSTCLLILVRVVLTLIGIALSGVVAFLMIAKGIPFLLTGTF